LELTDHSLQILFWVECVEIIQRLGAGTHLVTGQEQMQLMIKYQTESQYTMNKKIQPLMSLYLFIYFFYNNSL
jgi:hypothetical protein